jgi:CubicO group peptidase (beta-lactamase class C family)
MYFAGQDVISAATTTHLVAEPGVRWKYANNDTLLLLRALRHALADDLRYLRYPYDELFHRIGMYNTWMETDYLGNFIGSSQVYTTARDLARFGLLYLNDGIWNGERLLPEGWTSYVARPASSLPARKGRQGYGAQFWLLDQLEGVPPGTYTASGNKGQLATIVPTQDMVVVRTGVNPQGVRWRQDTFVVDVIKAFGD